MLWEVNRTVCRVHWMVSESFLEKLWVRDIVFAEVEIISPDSHTDAPSVCNVIVYSAVGEETRSEVINAAAELPNLVLIHLSDEKLRNAREPYSLARFVFRNYIDFKIPNRSWDNSYILPLGFAARSVNPSAQRTHRALEWAFVGARKGKRNRILKHARRTRPFKEVLTEGFLGENSLPGPEVGRLYEQAKFVIVPPGNFHPETFRFYEALEAGAIPLVVGFRNASVLRKTSPELHFPVVPFAAAIPLVLWWSARNPKWLAMTQEKCVVSYSNLKARIARDFALAARAAVNGI